MNSITGYKVSISRGRIFLMRQLNNVRWEIADQLEWVKEYYEKKDGSETWKWVLAGQFPTLAKKHREVYDLKPIDDLGF